MAKFKVLKNNQTYMSWLRIYSHNLADPKSEFFKSALTFYCFFVNYSAMLACTVYFLEYKSSDIKTALGGFKITIALIQCGGVHFNIGNHMAKVKSMHLKLQETVDEGIFSLI